MIAMVTSSSMSVNPVVLSWLMASGSGAFDFRQRRHQLRNHRRCLGPIIDVLPKILGRRPMQHRHPGVAPDLRPQGLSFFPRHRLPIMGQPFGGGSDVGFLFWGRHMTDQQVEPLDVAHVKEIQERFLPYLWLSQRAVAQFEESLEGLPRIAGSNPRPDILHHFNWSVA